MCRMHQVSSGNLLMISHAAMQPCNHEAVARRGPIGRACVQVVPSQVNCVQVVPSQVNGEKYTTEMMSSGLRCQEGCYQGSRGLLVLPAASLRFFAPRVSPAPSCPLIDTLLVPRPGWIWLNEWQNKVPTLHLLPDTSCTYPMHPASPSSVLPLPSPSSVLHPSLLLGDLPVRILLC